MAMPVMPTAVVPQIPQATVSMSKSISNSFVNTLSTPTLPGAPQDKLQFPTKPSAVAAPPLASRQQHSNPVLPRTNNLLNTIPAPTPVSDSGEKKPPPAPPPPSTTASTFIPSADFRPLTTASSFNLGDLNSIGSHLLDLADLKETDLDQLLPSLDGEPDLLEGLANSVDDCKYLINPLTGELEPHLSGESDDGEGPSDVFTGLLSPPTLSDDDTNSTSRPDTTDHSDSESRSTNSDSSKHSRLKSIKSKERGMICLLH